MLDKLRSSGEAKSVCTVDGYRGNFRFRMLMILLLYIYKLAAGRCNESETDPGTSFDWPVVCVT